jgi:hypothetical protein
MSLKHSHSNFQLSQIRLTDCATDDLDGWSESKNGKTIRHAGTIRIDDRHVIALKRRSAGRVDLAAVGPIGWFDFQRAAEAIKIGADATEKSIDQINEAVVALSHPVTANATPK